MRKLLLSVVMAVCCVCGAYADIGDFFTDASGIRYCVVSADEAMVYDGTKCTGSVVIPATVKSGDATYSVVKIGARAFFKSQVTCITIPEPVTFIGACAFSCCPQLAEVRFNAADCCVEQTGRFAPFSSSTAIAKVSFGDKVRVIPALFACATYNSKAPDTAFSRITSVTIPASVTRIEAEAFAACAQLKSVDCRSSQLEYADLSGTLWEASLPDNAISYLGNLMYCIRGKLTGKVSIAKGTTNLLSFAGQDAMTELVIPEGIERIPEGTFCNCLGLTTLHLPASMRVVEDGAFAAQVDELIPLANILFAGYNYQYANFCGTRWHADLDNGVHYLGTYLYLINSPVTGTVTLPDGVRRLPDLSAHGYIEGIVLPASIDTVHGHLLPCKSMKSIKCKATVPPIFTDATLPVLNILANGGGLDVPSDAAAAYAKADGWSLFSMKAQTYAGTRADIIGLWGDTVRVELSDGLTFTLLGDTLRCTNPMLGKDYYRLDRCYYKVDIVGYTAAKSPTLEQLEPDDPGHKHRATFRLQHDGIMVEGLDKSTRVAVVTTDGHVVWSTKADGSAFVPRRILPTGNVIIKAGNDGLKLMNR